MTMHMDDSVGQDAVQAYLDDLLLEDESAASPVPACEASTPAAEEYCAFELNGLKLLIPAAAIATVDEAPPAITGTCHDSWLAGYCLIDADSLPVVDAPRLLGLPDSALVAGRAGALVKLAGRNAAVAVPARGQPVSVDPETVTWRGSGGRRPWLAGTLATSYGVLLDVAGLSSLLATVDDRETATN